MNKPAATSPFAAMTHQEQRHQWNVWHARQDATRPVEDERPPESVQQLPDRAPEAPPEAPASPPEMPVSPAAPVLRPHHGQYDAVIRRLRAAGRQTQQFVSTSVSPEDSTVQPPSGRP